MTTIANKRRTDQVRKGIYGNVNYFVIASIGHYSEK